MIDDTFVVFEGQVASKLDPSCICQGWCWEESTMYLLAESFFLAHDILCHEPCVLLADLFCDSTLSVVQSLEPCS